MGHAERACPGRASIKKAGFDQAEKSSALRPFAAPLHQRAALPPESTRPANGKRREARLIYVGIGSLIVLAPLREGFGCYGVPPCVTCLSFNHRLFPAPRRETGIESVTRDEELLCGSIGFGLELAGLLAIPPGFPPGLG